MAAVLWLTRLAFVAFNVLLGVFFVMTKPDHCASVFEMKVGHALLGHVMSTTVVVDEFECQQKCLGNNSCKSFNVHPGADNTQQICELNNTTRKMKPKDFKKKKGSTYYGSVKISCVDISHENKKTNSGQCHPGYSGKNCERPLIGSKSHYPGHSCKDILDSGESRGDGEYWIDPEKNGNPLKVFCDMTTDGGGWLLISNVVLQSSTPPSQVPVKTSYRGISSDQMLLTKDATTELRRHLSFTQLRFHCSKQQGRTFHVTTVVNSTGDAVVRYFSGQTDVQPASCGSFVRMEDDNSRLAGVCRNWGGVAYGKWGYAGRDQDRLSYYPFFTYGEDCWFTVPPTFYCDDFYTHLVGFSAGDFWKVFVR